MKKRANYGVLVFAFVTMLFVFRRASQLNKDKEASIIEKLNNENKASLIQEEASMIVTQQQLMSKNIIQDKDINQKQHTKKTFDTILDVQVERPEKNAEVQPQKDAVIVEAQKDVVKVNPQNKILDRYDEYWFKWLDNPNMPDSGQVYKNAKERLKSRKSWMESTCKYMIKAGYKTPNMKPFQDEYKKHYMVNHDHRMLYCYLPKVANTNFRRVILGLEGVVPKNKVPNVDGYDVYFKYDDKYTYLQQFTERQQQALLHTYIKFMVVRDPLERLLSGYRNKYFHPNPNHVDEFLRKINVFYQEHGYLRDRIGIPIREDFRNVSLQFQEFLIFFTDTYDEEAFLNEHFTLSSQLCDPCKTKINFIAKYDTLYEDVDYIFQELKIDIPFPGRNDNYYVNKTTDVELQYYKQIPKWLLRKVWNIVKYDYVIFGFKVPHWFKQLLTL
ncbi:Sulfotransferase [Mactra antiquata]